MIFIAVGFLIILYAFIDFKKSFLIYLIYKVLLNGNITVLAVPGLPTLTLDLVMIIVYSILYFIRRDKYKKAKMSFDFTVPFLLLIISWILSSIYAVIGFENVYTRVISSILNEIVIVYIMWEVIEEEKDFKFLVKWFTIIFLCSCVYGIFEYLIQSNPLMEYEQTIIQDSSRVRDFSYSSSGERGYRISSFFEHAIGAGINWAMFIIWILVASIQCEWKLRPKYTALMTIILCVLCIIISKSRSPLLFLLIGSLAFVNFKRKKFYYIIMGLLVTLLVVLPFIGDNLELFLSIFSTSKQSNVSGSSIQMRLEQLYASLELLQQHPIVGWGYGFTRTIAGSRLSYQLRGMESIWFVTMTYYGIIGIITEVILAYVSLVKIPKKYKSRALFFFSLAYWVTFSITTFPGILTYMYYLIMFFIIKQSSVYKNHVTDRDEIGKKHKIKLK